MECSQKNCTETAQWSYVWPGKADRSYACSPHKDKAVAVSGIVGPLGDLMLIDEDGNRSIFDDVDE
tara:strand:+ start:3742 stop:3939 length:198 start_codon:yes stop_codon:yes gene_type:complete